MNFNKWLDTFVEEKGLDTEHQFEVEGPKMGTNWIQLGCVLDVCKNTSAEEQKKIKDTIVTIDFHNGNVMHFFNYLAKGLAV